MKKFKDGDRIKIWCEDSVEPKGGYWSTGIIKKVVIEKLIYVEDGSKKIDLESTIESFEGYKIEKLWTTDTNTSN
jgi:hypothetical protein